MMRAISLILALSALVAVQGVVLRGKPTSCACIIMHPPEWTASACLTKPPLLPSELQSCMQQISARSLRRRPHLLRTRAITAARACS